MSGYVINDTEHRVRVSRQSGTSRKTGAHASRVYRGD
jgi:hypothetical protein